MAKTKKQSENKPKKPDGRKNNPNIGRPAIKKTPELFKRIYDLIVTTPRSLYDICNENPDIPKPTTLLDWINHDEEFSRLYLEAKQKQVMSHVEETIRLADEMHTNGSHYIDEKGNSRVDPGWVAHTRQRIELRKWHAARLMPRLFGDKIQNETTVKIIPHEEAIKALDD